MAPQDLDQWAAGTGRILTSGLRFGAGRGVPFILASRMKHVSQGERVCCFDVWVRKTNSPEHTRLVQVGAWGEQKAFASTHVFLPLAYGGVS